MSSRDKFILKCKDRHILLWFIGVLGKCVDCGLSLKLFGHTLISLGWFKPCGVPFFMCGFPYSNMYLMWAVFIEKPGRICKILKTITCSWRNRHFSSESAWCSPGGLFSYRGGCIIPRSVGPPSTLEMNVLGILAPFEIVSSQREKILHIMIWSLIVAHLIGFFEITPYAWLGTYFVEKVYFCSKKFVFPDQHISHPPTKRTISRYLQLPTVY